MSKKKKEHAKAPRTKRRRSKRFAVLQVARATSRKRGFVVVICLILSGVAEGFGLASLMPLIALIGEQSGPPSALQRYMDQILSYLGLPAEPMVLFGILVAGMVVKAILTLIAMSQVGYAVAEVSTKMRMDLIQALLGARWNFFVRQPMGRFATALSVEAGRAGDAYNAMAVFLSHAVQALVYIVIAALVSWEAALLSIGVGAFMVLSLNRLLVAAKRDSRKQTKRTKALIRRLADVLVGIKPMKAMGRQARFAELFTKDIQEINRALRRIVFARHANRALQDPITAVCLGVAVYIALSVFKVPVAELVVMSILLLRIVSHIGKAQQDLQTLQIAESGFFAVRNAIDDSRIAREVTTGTAVPAFERVISLRNVSFAFADTPVIRDVTLDIAAGGVTTLTGLSGAGKTTLVDLMLGLHKPDTGDILVDGTSLSDVDLLRWRNMVGYVPQELILFHDTILNNVTLGQPEFSRADAEQALRQAGAWDFVSAAPEGLDYVVGERGSTLSGGQRQRIALARALVHKPKLLILDEATSALDPVTEGLIVRNVSELSRATGVTVLAISHQASWASVADNVYRVQEGNVIDLSLARGARQH
ncbi:MAG: P-loop containing nucleoside triphosphate hydrolase [Alphaproteobacteria bacterium]|jgi:ATP-binding cassette subfamily C protein|nr:P-loop containing nucleoside triphosphate hydrolase [Alphaproteobacteria bacterium]